MGSTHAQEGWKAELELSFAARRTRTDLVRRAHRGPLVVQRPFHPEPDGTCHVYLLHPPGGIVGGDVLDLRAHAEHDSQVLLTTPAATKCYRSDGRLARQHQRFQVDRGARMEWLPQETIIFDGAICELSTVVRLAPGAHYLGWDILCLGRPACGETFDRGELTVAMEIWRDELPLWIERFALVGVSGDGGQHCRNAHWGLAGQPVMGTLVCVTTETQGLVQRVRDALGDSNPGVVVSQLHDVLVCRYLGPSVEAARNGFIACWSELRRALWNCEAVLPRIWST